MLGQATVELSGDLSRLLTQLASVRGQYGLWLLDDKAELVSHGGASGLDGEPTFATDGGELHVRGLTGSRRAISRSIEFNGGQRMWMVVTHGADDCEEDRDAFADVVEQTLAKEGLRDYESEDTTKHLLSLFEQIRALHDLAGQLPGCDTTEEMGRLCLSSLMTAIGTRVAVLAVREEGRPEAKCIVMSDDGNECFARMESIDPAHGGPLAQAFEDAKVVYGPVSSFDIPEDSVLLDAHAAVLIVPVCFGSQDLAEVLGCFLLYDRIDSEDRVSQFGSPEAELTESVGVLLGLILGTRKRVQAEKELQIASAIQETLIPASAPNWTGLDLAARNITANQVGGDYFDFLEGKNGTRHMIIADVSGHNMASAMAMVMARTQFKSVLGHLESPSEIMGLVSGGLFHDLVRNELFITCFLLSVVDQRDGTVTIRYTNAGHNPPLLLRADGSLAWLEGGGGPMVGFMPAIDYTETEEQLEPGDLIVLYTDGVTEAVDAEGNMLDEEGLVEIVRGLAGRSSIEILDGIYDAVLEHTGTHEQSDDVTAMVLSVVGCPANVANEA